MAVVEVYNIQDYTNLLQTEFELDGVLCKVRQYLNPEQRIELNESRLQLRVYFSLVANQFSEADAKRFFSQFGPIDTIFFYPVKPSEGYKNEHKLFSGFVLFQMFETAKHCLRQDGILYYRGDMVRLLDHKSYQIYSSSKNQKKSLKQPQSNCDSEGPNHSLYRQQSLHQDPSKLQDSNIHKLLNYSPYVDPNFGSGAYLNHIDGFFGPSSNDYQVYPNNNTEHTSRRLNGHPMFPGISQNLHTGLEPNNKPKYFSLGRHVDLDSGINPGTESGALVQEASYNYWLQNRQQASSTAHGNSPAKQLRPTILNQAYPMPQNYPKVSINLHSRTIEAIPERSALMFRMNSSLLKRTN